MISAEGAQDRIPSKQSRQRLTSWQKLPSVVVSEALFTSGLDGICLDMANGWLSQESLATLLSYRSATGGATFVRTPELPAESLIGWLFDYGADGVIIPHVENAETARKYVRASTFAPDGARGMGSTGRAGAWGLGSREGYLAGEPKVSWAPRITAMIENAAALEGLDSFLSYTGLDAVMIGSADLMLSSGLDFEALLRLLPPVVDAARNASVVPAIAIGTAAQAEACFELGFDWCVVSNDITMLAKASAQNVVSLRAERTSPSGDRGVRKA